MPLCGLEVTLVREFLYPESVAVMGVSPSEDNLAKNAVYNLLEMGYKGRIYLVGRGAKDLFGLPIYPSIADVPGHVDLVNILTPARTLPGILQEWGEKGTRAAVLITAGFTEYGEERRGLEQEVLQTARRYGMRLIGPNCQGVINTDNGLCLPFVPFNRRSMRKGRVAIISQSGSIGIMAAYLLSDEPLGVSKLLSIGNKLDLKEVDLLPLLFEDEQTDIIFLYMEGIDRGRELMEVARRSPKPILVYKGNISQASARIAHSHTAALASDTAVTEAALRQANMVRVDRMAKFLSYTKALLLPPMKTNKLAVMSTFGGQAVISADAASQYGFDLPPIPDSVLEAISQHQRAKVVKIANPMDLGDVFEPEAYQAAVDAVMPLPEVDGVVMVLPYAPQPAYGMITTKPMLRHIRELSARLGKPVALTMLSEPGLLRQLQEEESLPYFASPEDAIEALAVSRDYWGKRDLPPEGPPKLEVDREMVSSLVEAAAGRVPTPDAARILRAYGIPAAEFRLSHTPEEAVEAAGRLGYPVVLKIESPDISHKSDVGGVLAGLKGEAEVRDAYQSIMEAAARNAPGARIEGVLVQPMVHGREVILGARQDETFGPVVMFGLGGIHVEVLKDVSFRVAPISAREGQEMVREIRARAILEGVRGQPPADTPFLAGCLVRLARLAADFPQVREIDVNPLMVFPQGEGGLAVDVRMVVGGPG